jgi:nitrite reductase/ring-hydroxylating ferredoxin subunit
MCGQRDGNAGAVHWVMALSRTPPSPGGTGWFPVARSADVGTAPVAVGAGDRPWVVVRLRPGGEVTALSPRCPHRLAPLTDATVVDGLLQCSRHGWRFAADGRCRDIPALGPDAAPPPRADLSAPWAVEERDGWVWIAPDRTLHHRPPRAAAATTAEPVPELPAPAGPVVDNLEPALAHAWHPVALADQLDDGGWLAVRLLGRTWTVERREGRLDAGPAAWGVREHLGVVWLAPDRPVGEEVEVPSAPGIRSRWLSPVRTSAPAAVVVDAFLDPARGGRVPSVPAVTTGRGGFTARWTDADAAVSVQLGAPLQLVRREDLADGSVRWAVLLVQPEDADATRIHLGAFVQGAAAPASRAALAAEVDRLGAELADVVTDRRWTGTAGLPLTLREEVHVATDAPGVALRRVLADFLVAARRAEGSTTVQDTTVRTTEEDTDVAAA